MKEITQTCPPPALTFHFHVVLEHTRSLSCTWKEKNPAPATSGRGVTVSMEVLTVVGDAANSGWQQLGFLIKSILFPLPDTEKKSI